MKKIASVFLIILVSISLLSTNLFSITAYAETNTMVLGTTVSGVQENGESYSFEFEVQKPGKVTIICSTESDVSEGDFYYSIYHEEFMVAACSTSWESLNGKYSYFCTHYLEKGTYVYSFTCSGNGTYTIESQVEEFQESFIETNEGGDNTAETANEISLSEEYYGLIMSGDVDVYKFSVPEKLSADISLKCYASSGWFLYTIYDEKLDVVLQKDLRHYNTEYGDVGEYINTHDLNAGNYYLLIEAAGSDFGGPYSFSINETHTTHSYSAWTTVDDTMHKRVCSVCQNEETSPHTLTNSTENDKKTYTCTLCGATITKDNTDSTLLQIQDNTDSTLLQILAITVGAAGLVAVILFFVKHKKKS